MRVEVERRTLRFRDPLATASGTLEQRELLLLTLVASDGTSGSGEAAPLEPYDGVSTEAAMAALEECRAALEASDGEDRERVLDACWLAAGLPQAVAAVDLALWDLAGKRAGRPVAALLAERPAARVEVNATIAAPDRAGAAAAAGAAVAAGFRCLKVKVGIGDDAGRLAAVRATVGPEVRIRIDANGAWSVPEAVAALEALEPVGIEFCEEPVHGLEGLAEVSARSRVPIAVDESASDPRAVTSGACDAVCLKVSRHGGISGVMHAARAARDAGTTVYLASTHDGPVGIAGALHAAAALAPLPPCGLATLSLLEVDDRGLAAADGSIAVPTGPGLGV